MTAALYLGATLLFGLASFVYYRGLFLVASVVGIAFGSILVKISFPALHPVVWSLMVASVVASTRFPSFSSTFCTAAPATSLF